MKALIAAVLIAAVPCMAQDMRAQATDAGVVLIPNDSAILLAQEMKSCEAERKSLKENAQSTPALIIIATVVTALAAGVAIGFAVEPLTHK